FFFVFQAEDGIRDRNVTGVQTCALPICTSASPTPGACQSSGTSSSSSSDCSSSRYLPDGCVGGPFQPFLKSSPDSTVNTGSCSQIGRASCRERVGIAVGAGW